MAGKVSKVNNSILLLLLGNSNCYYKCWKFNERSL